VERAAIFGTKFGEQRIAARRFYYFVAFIVPQWMLSGSALVAHRGDRSLTSSWSTPKLGHGEPWLAAEVC